MPKDKTPAVGDSIVIDFNTEGVKRPVIITSLNEDGTANGRLIYEPGDNPNNDGNFQTFYTNLKV